MEDSESREFDWLDDDVIVRQQPAIAIYRNPVGDVVLRQRGDDFYGDDSWVWFRIEHAPAVAAAILELANLDATALTPGPTLRRTKAKDPTAAGRQRRYREKQKKELTPEPDIFDRDTVTPEDRDVTPEERDTVTPRNGVTA